MAATWSWVVGPWSGDGPQYDLGRAARGRKATFKLTEASTASLALDGRHRLAGLVDELVTDLHLLRRPGPGMPAQRLYRGRVGATSDSLDADSHTVSVPTVDYRELLKRRQLWAASTLTWPSQDQGAIVAGLLAQTQSLPGGNLGITVTSPTTGVAKAREYAAGDKIGDLIGQLAESEDGFDWDIIPTSSTGLELTLWHPQRGQDRGVVLEHGGLVATVNRSVDPAAYANAVRVSGQAPAGGGTEPTPVELAAPDIATTPAGRWDAAFGEPLTTQAALDERAAWRRDQAQVVRPTYTLTLKRGAWRGPGHIWLGDTVQLRISSRPRLHVDTSLRVLELGVDLSDEGDEDVSITVGAPAPSYTRRASETERRLTQLERR